MMRAPCACDAFAIWYVELAGVDGAPKDYIVCQCGHPTTEHVATVGRCLGEVTLKPGEKVGR